MNNLPAVQSEKFSQSEIDLLRNTYAKGLSDTETSLFLKQAEAMNLNPFTKEIYGMVIKERLVLITSINGLRKVAHGSGNYLGCEVTVDKAGDKPISARAVVKKLVSGHVAEFAAEVMFNEYNTGANNWSKQPVTMLKKVAEAHALRMAFPSAETLYEESELGAIRKGPRESARAQELTEKFTAAPAREVTPHPEVVVEDASPDGGDELAGFVVGLGKHTGKRLSEVPKEDIQKFLDWAETQDLTPAGKAYYAAAKAYLK